MRISGVRLLLAGVLASGVVEAKEAPPAEAGLAELRTLQPGQTIGFCTVTGCKEDASLCPPNWTCLDLSAFQAGLPSIFNKPK